MKHKYPNAEVTWKRKEKLEMKVYTARHIHTVFMRIENGMYTTIIYPTPK